MIEEEELKEDEKKRLKEAIEAEERRVRVDSKEKIPPKKPTNIIDLLTRTDEELELISKQLDTLIKIFRGQIEGQFMFPYKVICNRYYVFTVDLTIERKKEPLGISDRIGTVVNRVTVTRLDDKAYWSRNDPSEPLEDLYFGYMIEDFVIKELYLTNPASTKPEGALMKVVVEWVE